MTALLQVTAVLEYLVLQFSFKCYFTEAIASMVAIYSLAM